MSINGAMLAGVSGLASNAAALSSISQNISNVNTVGYKRVATEFSTVVNTQSQGVAYSAGGVKANTRQFISQGGQLQRTTSSTDLAISGDGFFVVTEKSENLTPSDARLFTRAGAFTVDELGYLQNTAGFYLQGWNVDADGNVAIDPSDMNRLSSINVGKVGGAAEPTTRVSLNANLNSSTVPNAQIATYAEGAMALYARNPEDTNAIKPDFEITVPVSDSKGGQRNITISFLKSETANQWYAEIRAPENTVDEVASPNGLLKSGLVAFTQDGRFDATAMTALGTDALFNPANPVLDFAASGTTAVVGSPKWDDALGIAPQSITFDLNASAGGLTQYASTSFVQATYTNGTAFGNLTEIQIGDTGFVTAIFDNGVMRKIAQVALATFPSTNNLSEVSGNAYRVSQSSGTYNLKAPGTGGAGFIGSSQLEASTVDLSTEFTQLITTQRAYSASSKIITTADEMLAELINIKR